MSDLIPNRFRDRPLKIERAEKFLRVGFFLIVIGAAVAAGGLVMLLMGG